MTPDTDFTGERDGYVAGALTEMIVATLPEALCDVGEHAARTMVDPYGGVVTLSDGRQFRVAVTPV